MSEADFDTPEDAALAPWRGPGATVHVRNVDVRDHRAEVILDVAAYRDFVYCVRRNGRWREAVSGNGPTIGWDDPQRIQWE
ncbi:MAG TPA: hypothetical protein VGR26_09825 [Acidimicrobiales bacterium]|nr:hypothetical protein [Acidimicrobiales bacterium]